MVSLWLSGWALPDAGDGARSCERERLAEIRLAEVAEGPPPQGRSCLAPLEFRLSSSFFNHSTDSLPVMTIYTSTYPPLPPTPEVSASPPRSPCPPLSELGPRISAKKTLCELTLYRNRSGCSNSSLKTIPTLIWMRLQLSTSPSVSALSCHLIRHNSELCRSARRDSSGGTQTASKAHRTSSAILQ